MSKPKKLKIKSSDGDEFEVCDEVVKEMKTLKTMTEKITDSSSITFIAAINLITVFGVEFMCLRLNMIITTREENSPMHDKVPSR